MGRIINEYAPLMTPAELAQINAAVQQWIPKVRSVLKSSAKWFSDGKNQSFVTRGNRIEGKLSESITSNTGREYGLIFRVGFAFERHGVFVQKGVGRKYPITGPQPVKHPSGKTRIAVDWFNEEMEKYVPELADKLAEINANMAVNATRMRIN
jgi:hypothetical protein